MGAYGPGSISRLCKLAPPDLAIITAIGHAHYERFKSLETVAMTKFELARAVMEKGGKLIVTDGVLESPYAKDFCQRHREHVVVVGRAPECDLQVMKPDQTPAGLNVEVIWEHKGYDLHSTLYGDHHAQNLAVAFAAACILGVPPEDVAMVVNAIPQINHRLEVKRQQNGQILIDDAYNSNPVGFVNGLDILSLLSGKTGRRILVTPGMVELGSAHDQAHRTIGSYAGSRVDVLLAVLPQRISTLIEAYGEANANGIVVSCANLTEARSWLTANATKGDVVLLENDLPDLYENFLRL